MSRVTYGHVVLELLVIHGSFNTFVLHQQSLVCVLHPHTVDDQKYCTFPEWATNDVDTGEFIVKQW